MGDTYVWRRTGGGDIAAAANWQDVTTGQNPASAPPGPDDAATISATGTLTGTAAVDQLTLSSPGTLALTHLSLTANAATLSGNLAFNIGARLTAATGLSIAGTTEVNAGAALSLANGPLVVAGTAASLTVTGIGANVAVTDSISGFGMIGGLSNGSAQVTVSNFGHFSETGALMIGHETGSGSLTVTGPGAMASLGTVFLGNGGSGSILVANGGAVSAQSVFVGTTGYAPQTVSGSGTVTVQGAGSKLTLSAALDIGGEYIAEQRSDQGIVTVAAGATLAVTAPAGSSQPGIVVGAQAYGSGQLTVTDPGTKVSSSAPMVVGYYGVGTLNLLNGAAVTVVGTATTAGLIAGDLENFGTSSHVPAVSMAMITVSGAGSVLTVASSAMMVGLYGGGMLTVSAGGKVISGALGAGPSTIGVGAGGSGSVTITGPGSSWTDTGILDIGYGGASPYGGVSDSGALTVAAGATMMLRGGASASLDIGGSSGKGNLLVTGAGSTLTDTGALVVGAGGSGMVAVADHGVVIARSLAVGDATATGSGTVVLTGAGATLAVQGAATLTAGAVSMAGGTLAVGSQLALGSGMTVTGYGLIAAGAVINAANVAAQGGALTFIGAIAGTGAMQIAAGATLALESQVGSNQTVSFSTGGGLLDLGDPTHVLSHIAGFGASDQIDLAHLTTRSLSYSGQTLTVHAVDGRSAALTFVGSYTTANFTAASDGHGGSLISYHS